MILGIACLALSGCRLKPPMVLLCIIGDEGLICHDDRLPEGEEDFVIPHEESKNMVCTTADDFQTLKEYVLRRCKK